MALFEAALGGAGVAVRHPDELEPDLVRLLGPSRSGGRRVAELAIATAAGGYALLDGGVATGAPAPRGPTLLALTEAVTSHIAGGLDSAVALHAGSVALGGRSILVPGQSGAGKSLLTAWFAANGFAYLGDELAAVSEEGVEGFSRALMLKPEAEALLPSLPAIAACPRLDLAPGLAIRPPAADVRRPLPCGLIIFVAFTPGADLAIRPLTPARAALRLMAANVNTRNLADGGLAIVSALTRSAPAIELTYGGFDRIDGVLDALAAAVLEGRLAPATMRRLGAAFASAGAPATTAVPAQPAAAVEIPAPTPRRAPARLTIGMATYDDYDGVYFTVQAIRMYHPEIVDSVEFLVIDNHPEGACAKPLKALENHVANYRYVPEPQRAGTAVRDRLFEEASGTFVLCMDCHVFVVPGALKRLLDDLEANPGTNDLYQGPLLHDDLKTLSAHFAPTWRAGMFGVWSTDGRADDPEAPPFDIPMQGLGLFAGRREAWPGFNRLFRGFGGEEGYIHEKVRQRGGRTLCLPYLRWMHRFNRPLGIPYVNRWEDRIWNYMVGHAELGLPTDELEAHFDELLGTAVSGPIFAAIRAELAGAGLREVRRPADRTQDAAAPAGSS